MHTQLFINNEYVDSKSGETLEVYNPHDESLVAKGVQVAGQADVDAAVSAAQAAFKTWKITSAAERTKIMHKFADLLEANAEKIMPLEAKAMGQPISVLRMIFGMAASIFRYYAGWTDKIAGEQHPEADGYYRIIQYQPLGVCAGIGAWNASIAFFAFKTAAAVAAGCTLIYKGSEKSPLALLQLGDLIKEAGFPPGVVQIVTGDGKTGAMLASHMDINKISFTGSVFAGKKVQELAAKSNLKRVVLELGGKSPSIIFEDANLENALTHTSQNFLFNTGQACIAATRTFVHESIVKEFVEQLKIRFEQLAHTTGNPLDEKTFLGPIVDGKQFERVMNYLEIGKTEAELVTGGTRRGKSGWYVEPTIFLNPGDDARIYREEIFGPVLTLRTFKTEEEAIKMANDTSFGLSSCVYTESTSRALRVATAFEAGMVNVNSSQTFGVDVAFGGWKNSGIGREAGKAGIMAYLESKTICINMKV